MKKKRILKDPDTGEIVGATRTPFSHQAKELNKQIFAEEFEKNRLEEEIPEKSFGMRGYLVVLLLLGLASLGIWNWKGSEGDSPPVAPPPSSLKAVSPVGGTVPEKEAEPEAKSSKKEEETSVFPVQTRVVDESRIQYRGAEKLIFLPNSVAPYSGVVQSFWPNGQNSKEFSVVEGRAQGSIGTWYENGQKKEEFTMEAGKVVSVEVWKPNGEKCPVSMIEEGNGVYVWYMADGTEKERIRYENGQPVASGNPQEE
jgi:cytoskeletal protein RodZ